MVNVESNGVVARHSSETNEHYTPPEIVEAARASLGGTIDIDPFSCAKANKVVRAAQFYTRPESPDIVGGFGLTWHGHAFVNPPGGLSDAKGWRVINASKGAPSCRVSGACGLRPGHDHDGVDSSQKRAWFKLALEYGARRVTSALFVCFSVELLQTTQVDTPAGRAPPLDFPICYPSRRLAYYHEDTAGKLVKGGSPPHSSCLIFLPGRHHSNPTMFDGGAIDRFRKAFAPIGRIVEPHGDHP